MGFRWKSERKIDVFRPSNFIEGWVSGLNQQFAKLRTGLNLSTGSNPVSSTVCSVTKLAYVPSCLGGVEKEID
jgi:hypothetical protein